MRRWHIVTLVVAVVVACGGGDSEPERPPTAEPNPTASTIPLVDFGTGLIAFVSDREVNLEIYVMNPDGTNVTRITNSPGFGYSPRWHGAR